MSIIGRRASARGYPLRVSPSDILSVAHSGASVTLVITRSCVLTAEAMELRDEVERFIADSLASTRELHLDLSRVEMMGSRGFESLIVLHRACKDRGIRITTSRQTEMFRQLMSRMGFAKLFEESDRAS